MRKFAKTSGLLGASLMFGLVGGLAFAGVPTAIIEAQKPALEIIRVNDMVHSNAQFRQWLLKRAKTSQKAARGVGYLERTRLNQTLTDAEYEEARELLADFSTDRDRRYNAYLRQKSGADREAEIVLAAELGASARDLDIDSVELDTLKRAYETRFQRDRERETDFVVWVRAQNDDDAATYIAELDGTERPQGAEPDAESTARANLLARYNEKKNTLVGEYANARNDVGDAVGGLTKSVKKRREPGSATGQGALALSEQELKAIDESFDRFEAAEKQADLEFGETAWQNILGASSNFVDEDQADLIMQSRYEPHCGQCSAQMLGDLDDLDTFIAENEAPPGATHDYHLVEFLHSKGLNAKSVRFDFEEKLAMSQVDRVIMRRKAIDGAFAATDRPIIFSVYNDDEFRRNLRYLDAYNDETAVAGIGDVKTTGAVEQALGPERWKRLQAIKARSTYNHWIAAKDIRQINNRAHARVLDSDAGVYDTPLARIINAQAFAIVYVEPLELDPPEEPEEGE